MSLSLSLMSASCLLIHENRCNPQIPPVTLSSWVYLSLMVQAHIFQESLINLKWKLKAAEIWRSLSLSVSDSRSWVTKEALNYQWQLYKDGILGWQFVDSLGQWSLYSCPRTIFLYHKEKCEMCVIEPQPTPTKPETVEVEPRLLFLYKFSRWACARSDLRITALVKTKK